MLWDLTGKFSQVLEGKAGKNRLNYRIKKKFLIEVLVDLQCINFCCTAKWFSYIHIYIYTHIYIYILIHSFYYGSSQDIEYSSLCYTVDFIIYPSYM